MSTHSQEDLKDRAWMKVREWPQTPGFDAAQAAVTQAILNCYTREGGEWRPLPAATLSELAQEGDEYIAIFPFPEERTAILAGIRHLSATHRHRFRTPAQIAMAGGEPWVISLETLMSMLVDELGETHVGAEMTSRELRGPDPTLLLSRIRQSVNAIGNVLDARAGEVDALWSADPLTFIESEQAGLLGHMVHPTPKSRWGMEHAATVAYGPESQARFALQWLAVDPALVEQDSATGTPAGAHRGAAARRPRRRRRGARRRARRSRAAGAAARAPLGVRLPARPKPVSALLADGRIVDLGALGSEVAPTPRCAPSTTPSGRGSSRSPCTRT